MLFLTTPRGVPLMEAFRRLSDPDEISKLDHLKKLYEEAAHKSADQRSDEEFQAVKEYFDLNQTMLDSFKELLVTLKATITALELPLHASSRRKELSAEIWQILSVNFFESTARAEGLNLAYIEVSSVYKINENGAFVKLDLSPERPLKQEIRPEFQHSDNFEKITIREVEFKLSGLQARIIEELYRLSGTGMGWVNGKQLLAQVGSESEHISTLFKHHKSPSWKELIENGNRGMYRLNLKWSRLAS